MASLLPEYAPDQNQSLLPSVETPTMAPSLRYGGMSQIGKGFVGGGYAADSAATSLDAEERLARGDTAGYQQSMLRSKSLREQSAQLAPNVATPGDVHGAGDALDYAGYNIGQMAGMGAPSVAGGAAAGLIAGVLTRGALRTPASIFGAALPNYQMNKGFNVQAQQDDPTIQANTTPQQRLDAASHTAAVQALPDAVVPGIVGSQLAGSALRKGFGQTLRHIPGAVAGEAVIGSGAMGWQTHAQQGMLNDLDPNRDRSHDDEELRNAMITGAVGAAGMGLPGHAASLGYSAIGDTGRAGVKGGKLAADKAIDLGQAAVEKSKPTLVDFIRGAKGEPPIDLREPTLDIPPGASPADTQAAMDAHGQAMEGAAGRMADMLRKAAELPGVPEDLRQRAMELINEPPTAHDAGSSLRDFVSNARPVIERAMKLDTYKTAWNEFMGERPRSDVKPNVEMDATDQLAHHELTAALDPDAVHALGGDVTPLLDAVKPLFTGKATRQELSRALPAMSALYGGRLGDVVERVAAAYQRDGQEYKAQDVAQSFIDAVNQRKVAEQSKALIAEHHLTNEARVFMHRHGLDADAMAKATDRVLSTKGNKAMREQIAAAYGDAWGLVKKGFNDIDERTYKPIEESLKGQLRDAAGEHDGPEDRSPTDAGEAMGEHAEGDQAFETRKAERAQAKTRPAKYKFLGPGTKLDGAQDVTTARMYVEGSPQHIAALEATRKAFPDKEVTSVAAKQLAQDENIPLGVILGSQLKHFKKATTPEQKAEAMQAHLSRKSLSDVRQEKAKFLNAIDRMAYDEAAQVTDNKADFDHVYAGEKARLTKQAAPVLEAFEARLAGDSSYTEPAKREDQYAPKDAASELHAIRVTEPSDRETTSFDSVEIADLARKGKSDAHANSGGGLGLVKDGFFWLKSHDGKMLQFHRDDVRYLATGKIFNSEQNVYNRDERPTPKNALMGGISAMLDSAAIDGKAGIAVRKEKDGAFVRLNNRSFDELAKGLAGDERADKSPTARRIDDAARESIDDIKQLKLSDMTDTEAMVEHEAQRVLAKARLDEEIEGVKADIQEYRDGGHTEKLKRANSQLEELRAQRENLKDGEDLPTDQTVEPTDMEKRAFDIAKQRIEAAIEARRTEETKYDEFGSKVSEPLTGAEGDTTPVKHDLRDWVPAPGDSKREVAVQHKADTAQRDVSADTDAERKALAERNRSQQRDTDEPDRKRASELLAKIGNALTGKKSDPEALKKARDLLMRGDYPSAKKIYERVTGDKLTKPGAQPDKAAIDRAIEEAKAEAPRTLKKELNEFHDTSRPVTDRDRYVFDAVAEKESPESILRDIEKRSTNPFFRVLAKQLREARLFPDKMFIGVDKPGVAGLFSTVSRELQLIRPENAEATFLHEMVHSATVDALARPESLHSAQALHSLFLHVKDELFEQGHYGVTNIDEFVAEAFTNPEFQASLNKIKVPAKGGAVISAFKALVHAVGRLLGLPIEHDTALAEALRQGTKLLKDAGLVDRELNKRGEYPDREAMRHDNLYTRDFRNLRDDATVGEKAAAEMRERGRSMLDDQLDLYTDDPEHGDAAASLQAEFRKVPNDVPLDAIVAKAEKELPEGHPMTAELRAQLEYEREDPSKANLDNAIRGRARMAAQGIADALERLQLNEKQLEKYQPILDRVHNYEIDDSSTGWGLDVVGSTKRADWKAVREFAQKLPNEDRMKWPLLRAAMHMLDGGVSDVLHSKVDPTAERKTPEEMQAIRDDTAKKLGPKIKVEFGDMLSHSGEYDLTHDVIKLAMSAGHGTEYHEQLHAFIKRLTEAGRGDVVRVLENAANSKAVIERMRQLLEQEPKALKQLSDPAERLAYMYQFAMGGLLKIGPQTEGLFRKITDKLRRVFGHLSNEQRAHDIFESFNEGKLSDISAADRVLDKHMERNKFVDGAVERAKPAVEFARKMLLPGSDNLRNGPSDTGRVIADKFSNEMKTGYLDRKPIERGKWINRFTKSLDGLNDTEIEQLRQYMNKEVNRPASKRVHAAAETLSQVFKDVRDYANKAGVGLKNRDDYFPQVWSPEAVAKGAEEFKALLLQDKYKDELAKITERAQLAENESAKADGREAKTLTPADMAEKFVSGITTGNDHKLPEDISYTPCMAADNVRALDFIGHEEFAKFFEKNMVKTLAGYTEQVVKKSEYVRQFGMPDKEGHDRLHTMLRKAEKELQAHAKGEKNPTKFVVSKLRAMRADVNGMLGTLGGSMSATAHKITSWAMVYQNIRTLPLAIFSQVIDPFGVAVRSGQFSDAGTAFKRGINGIIEQFKGERKDDAMRELAETIGVIERATMSEAVSDSYSSLYMSPTARKANNLLFKYNLMESWSRGLRVGATEVGVKSLQKWATTEGEHHARWLKELGFKKPGDVPMKDGKVDVSDERVQSAIARFVDTAVLRPNASQRPTWSNDPRWAIFFQLKQFQYAFSKVILARAGHEMKHGNTTPVIALAASIPAIIAGDFMRGLIQGQGVLPPGMQGWTPGMWVEHGMARAGLAGLADEPIDLALNPTMAFGPTFQQGVGLMSDPVSKSAMSALPLNPLFKYW